MPLPGSIARELGVTVQNAKSAALGYEQLLVLGSGTYGGKPGEAMMKYIGAGTFAGRKVAIFSSVLPEGPGERKK